MDEYDRKRVYVPDPQRRNGYFSALPFFPQLIVLCKNIERLSGYSVR